MQNKGNVSLQEVSEGITTPGFLPKRVGVSGQGGAKLPRSCEVAHGCGNVWSPLSGRRIYDANALSCVCNSIRGSTWPGLRHLHLLCLLQWPPTPPPHLQGYSRALVDQQPPLWPALVFNGAAPAPLLWGHHSEVALALLPQGPGQA